MTWTHCRNPRRVHTSWYPCREPVSEPHHVYAGLHTSSSRVVVVSLLLGRSQRHTARSSRRSWTPEHGKNQWSHSWKVRPESSSSTQCSHTSRKRTVETQPFIHLVLVGGELELLLHTLHASSNLPKLQEPVVSRTHVESPPSVTKARKCVRIPTCQVWPFLARKHVHREYEQRDTNTERKWKKTHARETHTHKVHVHTAYMRICIYEYQPSSRESIR